MRPAECCLAWDPAQTGGQGLTVLSEGTVQADCVAVVTPRHDRLRAVHTLSRPLKKPLAPPFGTKPVASLERCGLVVVSHIRRQEAQMTNPMFFDRPVRLLPIIALVAAGQEP
jgi:hypothetical protein